MNAIETLCVLLQGIFDKRFNNFSFEVINLLTGLSNADIVFPKLIDGIYSLMNEGESVEIKCEALRLAIVTVCGNSNINQNSINEYFMKNEIFEPLSKIIMLPETSHVAFDGIMLLGILANYNKHESKNPYLLKISEIRDEAFLQKIMETVASICLRCRSQYIDIQDDDETHKYSVNSVLSYVGTFLPWGGNGDNTRKKINDPDPELSFGRLPPADIAILLILYDLVNNNRRFVAHLAKSITENDNKSNDQTSSDNDGVPVIDFLSFSSYLLQHNRSVRTAGYSKITLLILTILLEDEMFNENICDERKIYCVRLCRQRAPILASIKTPCPLACTILDISIGFINHNMKKRLATDLFSLALRIIYRILCHLKKSRIRLNYHWTELWNSLTGLLKFILSNNDYFNQDRSSINEVLISAINILNICITFGDSFLPDPAAYDNLFYEIVRTDEVFKNLHEILYDQDSNENLENSKKSASQKSFASSDPDILTNIITVCEHFHLKIEAWKLSNNVKFLLPEQVLAIINKNYESLELSTFEKVDLYVRYSENPYYVSFLRHVLRVIVEDFKSKAFQ
ncbi:9681_t:CDS:10 [Acaulospora morrowiae]|uniref:9681_t:CDS:1 n=1 Tax=Acaulospora morrowiae TaxID=94023 RepID=A0A9N9CEV0_9GLOM|nr:9681_t:CDS:10 [Acaulospora morrowiae]